MILDALLSLLKAMAGMAIVLGFWYGVQWFVRRYSGPSIPPGEDILEHMAHGCCGGCSSSGHCENRKVEESESTYERNHHHHEPA